MHHKNLAGTRVALDPRDNNEIMGSLSRYSFLGLLAALRILTSADVDDWLRDRAL